MICCIVSHASWNTRACIHCARNRGSEVVMTPVLTATVGAAIGLTHSVWIRDMHLWCVEASLFLRANDLQVCCRFLQRWSQEKTRCQRSSFCPRLRHLGASDHSERVSQFVVPVLAAPSSFRACYTGPTLLRTWSRRELAKCLTSPFGRRQTQYVR